MSAGTPAQPDPAAILATSVHTDGGAKPFGDLRLADVQARAQELRDATGWGPTARIASVARAWGELGRAMEAAGAAQVRELEPGAVAEQAQKLWIVPPGGSLLAGGASPQSEGSESARKTAQSEGSE